MKAELKWRLAVVAAVAILSIVLIIPTFRYFLGVSGVTSPTAERLEELRLQSIPLGLDLQGGVDVLLSIDEQAARVSKVEKVAENLRRAFISESPAIDATVDMQTSGTDAGVIVTLHKADQERALDLVLSRYAEMFTNYSEGVVKAGASTKLLLNNREVTRELTTSIDSALKVIRDRVDNLGVTMPSVTKQGDSRIRVQIPGEKNPERVIKTVIRPAQLEFRGLKTGDSPDANGDYREETAAYIDPMTGKNREGKVLPPGYEVHKLKTSEMDPVSKEKKSVDRYVLLKSRVEMRGDSLQDAWVAVNPANMESPVEVHLTFKPDGAKRFGEITKNYLKKPLAIVLDGVVYSYPRIQSVIDGGQCVITGDFTVEEGQDLSMVLKAGALPAGLTPIQTQKVEATLGADSVSASVLALIIGSLMVAVMMIGYYHAAGFLAVVAVIINVLIIFAFMKLASATLTLSGIGGILLTVGMAVDANVLIYERIREELFYYKKPIKQAISLGFGRAFGVIFDGNLTTMISGLILLQFGTGSVKGFALALNVGIVATLFTGLFCTHTLVDAWFDRFKKIGLGTFEWFKTGFFFDFFKLRYFSFSWSGALLLLSLYIILPIPHAIGIRWGVDFTGGLLTTIKTTEALSTQQVAGDYKEWRVQKVSGENTFIVRTKFVEDAAKEEGGVIAGTEKFVAKQLDKTVGAGKYTIASNDAVSSEVGNEFKGMAILSCILCSIGILIYMAFRFEFLFGCAAVLALFHDLIITVGLFSLFGWLGWAGDMSLDVLSALLVLLGHSVNDTIIIFDRIRENRKLHPMRPFVENSNWAVCESLNRTVMTVGTVLLCLIAMLVWGGAGLFDFALVMLIGVIKGTYSSSFIAAPLLVDFEHWKEDRKRGKSVKQVTPLLNK